MNDEIVGEARSLDDSALAQPISLGPVKLRNRIVLAPITSNYADPGGYVTDKTLGFYEERAKGGVAGIIFEATGIMPRNRLTPLQHGLYDDSFIPGLKEVTRRVHDHGAAIFVQLCHGGAKAGSAVNGVRPVSVSEVPVKAADIPRPITDEELARAIQDFADAAVRAREAGFDGVELHAAHFYLLSTFLSGYFNHRTDRYGGSVENRARLTREVIQAVKAAAGRNFPVICRIHGREHLPGGIDEAEAAEIARLLARSGADAIHVSAATLPVNPKIESHYAVKVGGPPTKETPAGCFLDYAAPVKRAVDVPVIAVGKLNDPAVADQAVREGITDLVAIARGLIADPYLPRKVLEGRPEDIVRCTDCLTCHTTIQTGRVMGCGTNPKPWRPKGEAKGSYLANWKQFSE